jgi:hypothetical protein
MQCACASRAYLALEEGVILCVQGLHLALLLGDLGLELLGLMRHLACPHLGRRLVRFELAPQRIQLRLEAAQTRVSWCGLPPAGEYHRTMKMKRARLFRDSPYLSACAALSAAICSMRALTETRLCLSAWMPAFSRSSYAKDMAALS